MKTKRTGPLVLAVVAAIVLLAGASVVPASAQEPTPTPTPVTTGNIPLIAISPALCFPLVVAKFPDTTSGAAAANNCGLIDSKAATQGNTSTQGHDSLMALEAILGNGDGILTPSDFAGIDLDGNQVHQSDDSGNGTSLYDGNLFILAFVTTKAPVRFHTNLGTMVPAGLAAPAQDTTINPADSASQTYVCDSQAGTASGPLVEDADCSSASTSSADGVVVGRLRAHWGSLTAPIGPGTVTVNQGQSDVGTIAFRVVGEPRSLSFITLETQIQDGAGGTGQCPLATTASGFLGANGTAEKSIVLAVAKDIDGNAVTGAVINWSTDDANKAIMAAPLTPTLDLGSFGFGAPNIICGNTTTGTVTVKASISTDLLIVTGFDPGASEATHTTTFTVTGVPASITLTADPAAIPCDGTATTTVSAAVVDASGTPATAGTKVHFDVQVLGTANPIDTTTNDKGVATSVISPLAGDSGVPVTVSSGNVISQILVTCSTTTPGAPTPPPGGGAGGGGTTPGGGAGGSIQPPNTGSGVAGSGGGTIWIYLVALGAVGLLAGSALILTGARTRSR
jgi:hypothetical protein